MRGRHPHAVLRLPAQVVGHQAAAREVLELPAAKGRGELEAPRAAGLRPGAAAGDHALDEGQLLPAAGEAGVDLILLGLADLKGTRGPNLTQETWTAAIDVARIFLENFWEKPEETVAPLRLVDGHDIIKEYNIPEGPVIGKLLEAIREAQATGKVITREEAISFGREWLKENQNESGLF